MQRVQCCNTDAPFLYPLKSRRYLISLMYAAKEPTFIQLSTLSIILWKGWKIWKEWRSVTFRDCENDSRLNLIPIYFLKSKTVQR